MGVDAECLLGYGIFLDTTSIQENSTNNNEIFEYTEDEGMVYDYWALEDSKKPYMIINEPYGGDWCFIGINFWGNSINDMIENLKQVEEQWSELKADILSKAPKDSTLYKELSEKEPHITLEPYFS